MSKNKTTGNGVAVKASDKVVSEAGSKAKSQAAVDGMFQVPADKKEQIANFDLRGSEIQRQLGALEMDYISKKNSFLQQFHLNQSAQSKVLDECLAEAGIDISSGKEAWTYDIKTGTCTRTSQATVANVEQSK